MTLPADSRVASRVGVGRFRDTPDNYDGVDQNDRPVGSTSMTLAFLIHVSRAIDALQFVATHDNSNGRGWSVTFDSAGAVQVIVGDGAGVAVNATLATAAPHRATVALLASYDGDTLRVRAHGETASQAAGTAGYTNPIQKISLGQRNVNDFVLVDGAILGFLGTDSQALSAAQLSTLEDELIDNVEQGRDFDAGLSVFSPEVLYDARDLLVSGATPAASWSDRNGNGVDLTKNGAPELVEVASRF